MVRYVAAALLLLPSMIASAHAADTPAAFSETSAVLLNVSERDLNRIVVDSFHAKGGPRFTGERERVSSSVGALRYDALFSDPVVRIGADATARLSLDIKDATLRIGRLERKIGGLQARCEDAGLDIDPRRPLAVELAVDLTIESGALRLVPTSVAIPDVEDRLQLVEPARCSHTILPRWFLWWVGKPYLRRSFGDLEQTVLTRARKSAARFEEKERLLKRWEIPSGLRLFPETVDTRGGSVLVGLTASSVGPSEGRVQPRLLDDRAPRPSGSFLGVSESFVNEVARRVLSGRTGSRHGSAGNVQKLLKSDAAYALVPGLRTIDAKDSVDLDIRFPAAPRFEFRSFEEPAGSESRAVIRVLLSDVELNLRKTHDGQSSVLGTLRIDSARMSVVPFVNLLGGISFRLVENQWKVSSTGLEFDEDLVAATLQEVTFGKVFETSYDPLLTRTLRLGRTEFLPQQFAVNDGYLLIGLGEPRPSAPASAASADAKQTHTLLGSR